MGWDGLARVDEVPVAGGLFCRHGRFRGLILSAGLKRSIWVWGGGISNRRRTVGFKLLGGLLLN